MPGITIMKYLQRDDLTEHQLSYRDAIVAIYKELQAKGMPADFDDILKNVEERDYIDTHRATSPLRQADDALLLDNSNLTIAEQKQWLMKMFEERTK